MAASIGLLSSQAFLLTTGNINDTQTPFMSLQKIIGVLLAHAGAASFAGRFRSIL